MGRIRNFARFYVLFNKLPHASEEVKKELVRTFTKGRTSSLREMRFDEYNMMCDALTYQGNVKKGDFTYEIKRLRSAVLKRLQKMGIDTTDWTKVDNFCLNKRIAGKAFRYLTLDELTLLVKKLETISRKTQKVQPHRNHCRIVYMINNIIIGEA